MKYEFEILAALIQYKYPNIKLIANATGISERKVQSVIHTLTTELGLGIEKVTEKAADDPISYLHVRSWGIFESGNALKKQLISLDLVKAKSARLETMKKRKTALGSFPEKKAYSDAVKVQNYQESMRLEGIHPASFSPEQDKQQLKRKREALIKLYTTKAQEQLRHVG
ncbi:hypothetical protein VA7868_03331 [Vibrio aerogenes CECT 7868]|uniref:Uncharacterized protein n=1 Tax=Vibrio aerogenes CECT 7868 TaxID=1216006 RepID=A0A1M5ZW30_9VIBR|nr:YhfG family protein [Vibrio aerogenes]SHI28497.1 hypothetical protein VA7868_03331 [Vibrio aerogenes CECT 7868]